MDKQDSVTQAARTLGSLGGKKGGPARAAALSPERRSELSRKAAAARWKDRVLKATHTGVLVIGDLELDCAVLEDGRRVLSDSSILRALGRGRPSGKAYRLRSKEGCDHLPIYLADPKLKPFVPEDFTAATIRYAHPSYGEANGIEATLVPKICEVWLRARDAGELNHQQRDTAQRAQILICGLAQVGIIALVDEATGYQYDRARAALAAILEKFIAKELAGWVRVFSDDYYKQLFRLSNLSYEEGSNKRPLIIGRRTADIVYDRLAPGVLDELRSKNPRVGLFRRVRHHQWLTKDHGYQRLKEHLSRVEALMTIAPDYATFELWLDRVSPRKGSTLLLPMPGLDAPTTEPRMDQAP